MCAVTASVAAQDGLRSASLPQSAPPPTIAVERDLFLVPPDFYIRRPDPWGSRLFFPQVLLWPPGVPTWQSPLSLYPQSLDIDEPVVQDIPNERSGVPLVSGADAAAIPAMPAPPMVPGPPKTFYVIPGCYAGDRPPAAESLRPGCDRSNMRVIPPGMKPSIAIVGAGLGGLTAAATLRQAGFDVRIYEQAGRFARIGAGIQMMPNSMKVLRRIGIEERVRGIVVRAVFASESRSGTPARCMRELPMPESLFGAPYLCMHRGDLHEALARRSCPADIVHLRQEAGGTRRARRSR